MRQLGYAITEGEMAYIRETEEFDQETLHILSMAEPTALGPCLLNTFSLWPNRASGTLIVSSTAR